MASLIIRGGTVVNHDHSRRADVLIDGETIVAVGSAIDAPSGATVVDAGGCYVMPGGIDPHTHLELAFMGSVSSDDFEWGTKAALAGGTTMIVDFCIPDPGQSMLAAYQDWRRKSEKAASDYGFHMAVTSWSEQVFDEMAIVVKTYGINTFKHFMAYKGALMVNDDELYNSFARCAQLGAMPLVHAENGDVVARMQEAVLGRGVTGPEGHAYSRPPEVEGEATNRAIMIADMTGAPLSGSLQVVATDHCAFTTEQKRLGIDDFRKIPNGTGGLEDRMPLLWTAAVNTGRLTKEEFVAVTSSNIARILNIYPKKGRLAAGSDADIVVWDPAASKTISANSQLSRIDYNVFEGYACIGAPVVTLSRGKLAWAMGELRAENGDGHYVERPPFSPVHVANSTWKQQSAPRAVRRADVTP
jgi:dihydroorotase-like cyclic amidohydrolase